MGVSTRILFLLMTMFMSQSVLAKSRYIVIFKSAESLQQARAKSRSNEFLGARATSPKYLENVDMAIITAEEDQVQGLARNNLVASIEKEYFFKAPRLNLGDVVDLSQTLNRQMDLPWGITAVKAPEAWAVTRGQDARVLVLDTGIDANHPDLKGRFEKGRSLISGNPSFADTEGHGTHVSGTILADGTGYGLLGVAPEARLLMGKVCGASGCSSAAIAEGVNWGIQEKVDVISMSLGGPFLFPSQAQAYKKAEQANIVVVAASGNGGTATVSYPAAVDTVIAVGAIQEDMKKASFSQWGPQLDVVAPGVNTISSVPVGTGREGSVAIDLGDGAEAVANSVFGNSSPTLNEVSTGELVYVGLGKPEDLVGKSLAGKVALIQRGEITFEEKVKAVSSKGVVGVIIFNNTEGLISGSIETPVKFPVMMIEQSVGLQIIENLNHGTATASMGVVATDFAAFQGTSMATPHVGGLVALIRSANKNLSAAQVRDIVKSTCTPLTPNPNNELGAGLINAEKAVKAAQALSIQQGFEFSKVAGF